MIFDVGEALAKALQIWDIPAVSTYLKIGKSNNTQLIGRVLNDKGCIFYADTNENELYLSTHKALYRSTHIIFGVTNLP